MTSWAVSLWAGFSETEEIRLYTEFASCNIYSIQHKHTQGAYWVKNKTDSHIVTLIKRVPHMSVEMFCIGWFVYWWKSRWRGRCVSVCLTLDPREQKTTESRLRHWLQHQLCGKPWARDRERGLHNKHKKNIQDLQEHALTWCVSCWTKRTGPEWSSVTRSMWMCVSRCVWVSVSRCMNVLRVLHCSFLNAQAVSIKNTVCVWGTIRNGADRP